MTVSDMQRCTVHKTENMPNHVNHGKWKIWKEPDRLKLHDTPSSLGLFSYDMSIFVNDRFIVRKSLYENE